MGKLIPVVIGFLAGYWTCYLAAWLACRPGRPSLDELASLEPEQKRPLTFAESNARSETETGGHDKG